MSLVKIDFGFELIKKKTIDCIIDLYMYVNAVFFGILSLHVDVERPLCFEVQWVFALILDFFTIDKQLCPQPKNF